MASLVGINHVALEVGDLDEALTWYGRFFEFELRGRPGSHMAFIDMGDQFIALASGRTQPPDGARHFGLVVDDKEAVRQRLRAEGVPVPASGSLEALPSIANGTPVTPLYGPPGFAVGRSFVADTCNMKLPGVLASPSLTVIVTA